MRSAITSSNYNLYSKIRLNYELTVRGYMASDFDCSVLGEVERRYIRSVIIDSMLRKGFYSYRRRAYGLLPEGDSFVIGPWGGWHGGLSLKVLLHRYNLVSDAD
ncbi:MAG: hypothetical protein ACI8Q1_000255 [Parvicella sp.]|jgi:hypothetical protein